MNQFDYCATHKIKTVSVVFQNQLKLDNPPLYTYLVPPMLKTPDLGDLVVVLVRDKYEVVKVVAHQPGLDPKAKFEYKYIISTIDGTAYKHALAAQSSVVERD